MSLSLKARVTAALLALIAWSALALQLYLTLATSHAEGVPVSRTLIRYFSFFTILSNLLVAFVLARSARDAERPGLQAAAAVYISVVGLGYTLLLRHIWNPQGLQKLADILLHDVVPVGYVLFWLIFCRKRKPLAWRSAFLWLIWPAIYLAYSMVCGSFTGWYPYHFLDPAEAGSASVISVIAIFVLAFLALGCAAIALTRSSFRDTR